jgi:hypothetical protein
MPAVIETERLEGISEGTPPCMCFWHRRRCPNLSSWRIISICPWCHHRASGFVCDRCHEDGVLGGFECGICLRIRGIDGYL